MKEFKIGNKYFAKSICDTNCIFEILVLNRTNKTITFVLDGVVKNKKINIFENEETVKLGNYSFAPTIRASNSSLA